MIGKAGISNLVATVLLVVTAVVLVISVSLYVFNILGNTAAHGFSLSNNNVICNNASFNNSLIIKYNNLKTKYNELLNAYEQLLSKVNNSALEGSLSQGINGHYFSIGYFEYVVDNLSTYFLVISMNNLGNNSLDIDNMTITIDNNVSALVPLNITYPPNSTDALVIALFSGVNEGYTVSTHGYFNSTMIQFNNTLPQDPINATVTINYDDSKTISMSINLQG